MTRKKRILIGIVVLLTLLIGIPAIRFYRHAQQNRKNQELIAAIKAGNEQKALEMLTEGADGGARDTGQPVSMGELLLRLFNNDPKPENGEKHLAAIVLLFQQDYGGRSPRHNPDPELVKALLERGAYLNEQDKEADTELMVFGRHAPYNIIPLYQRAEAANPTDPVWSERLGQIYAFNMSRETGDSKRKSATLSLAAYERALLRIKDSAERELVSIEAAKSAFEVSDLDKAHTYVEEALKATADSNSALYNDGDAIHSSHVILGRIALRKGDMKEAQAQLLAAGQAPSSSELNTSGPNMILAKELLEKGERQTVLEYFHQCSKFWNVKQLSDWSGQVRAGKIPNFRRNLDTGY